MTGFLTPEEVFERLTKLSPDTDSGVIDDVYDLAQKQLAAEDVLSGRLDARATSLFGAVGFSMTVAFSFGGWALLDNARKVPYGSGIAIAFVGVLLLGLVTSAFALAGLKLSRGHVVPDERELFDGDILWPGRKRADYRIFVAVHLWRIWQQRYVRNERRARRIVKGQILFFMFLLAILLLSVLTALSAIRRPAERHLLHLVRQHAAYYNEDRPHMSLDGDAPVAREVDPRELGKVVALPRVGGLHHRYVRRAA